MIRAWLKENNLEPSWVSVHHDYMKVSAPIAVWETLLEAEFYMFNDNTKESVQSIPRATSFSIPIHLKSHIFAMFHVAHLPPRISKRFIRKEVFKTVDNGLNLRRSVSDVSLSTPAFLNNLYNISGVGNVALQQSVFETADQDYSPSDLTTFQQLYNLNVQAAVDRDSPPGSNCNLAAGNCDEGNLDIQYIMGIAQFTTSVYWYVPGADPYTDFVTDLANMATPPTVNSISWGSIEQVLHRSINLYVYIVTPTVYNRKLIHNL